MVQIIHLKPNLQIFVLLFFASYFGCSSGIWALKTKIIDFHMIVIWRRRQTNQISSYDHFAFIRTFVISVAMNSRVLSKFDITFFAFFIPAPMCTVYKLLSCILFIYPFIIVFVLDARVQRLHFQRNIHTKIVDRIKLFLFRTFGVYSIISTPQFLIKYQLFLSINFQTRWKCLLACAFYFPDSTLFT